MLNVVVSDPTGYGSLESDVLVKKQDFDSQF